MLQRLYFGVPRPIYIEDHSGLDFWKTKLEFKPGLKPAQKTKETPNLSLIFIFFFGETKDWSYFLLSADDLVIFVPTSVLDKLMCKENKLNSYYTWVSW